MAGYIRNDTTNNIADGNIINASDLDGEFDAIASAFTTSGHVHDGTAQNGGAVTKVGPSQDLVISASQILPKTTNTLDIGSTALRIKDVYIADDKKIYFGNDNDVYITYDESTDDALKLQGSPVAVVAGSGETAELHIYADAGEDNADKWKIKVADGGGLTVTSKISGSDVAHLTWTPHATVASSTFAVAGGLTVAGSTTLAATSFGDADITNVGNIALDSLTADGSTITITGNTTFADGAYDFDVASHDTSNGLKLGGTLVSATAAELNLLDGVTATTAELNYLDVTTLGTSEASKVVTVDSSGDLIIPDSDKYKFGTGSDMQLYHDGTNSYITNAEGALKLATESSGIAITIGHTTSETTVADNLNVTGNAIVTGNLTINGTTTTVDSTNTAVKDNLMHLNTGVGSGSNGNDIGILMERGSTGNDAIFIWDESADKFSMGTSTSGATDTGNLNLTVGTLVANVEGTLATSGDCSMGVLTATELDISGNADIAGTLEADVITVNGTALATVITNTSPTMPAGVIVPYAGTSAPTGWVLCYGQSVTQGSSSSTYYALHAAIGTTYGSGSGGAGDFSIPDLRGRVVAGQDDMGGSSANRLTDQTGGLNGDTLGDTGGSETHTLLITQMAEHSHLPPTTALQNGVDVDGLSGAGSGTNSSRDAGPMVNEDGSSVTGGGAHNNVQPTIILNYIIKT